MPDAVPVIFLLFCKPQNAKFLENFLQYEAVQNVDLRPRNFALANSIHRWLVAGAPTVGKAGPIDSDALGFSPSCTFGNDRSAPINQGSECVEYQCLQPRA